MLDEYRGKQLAVIAWRPYGTRAVIFRTAGCLLRFGPSRISRREAETLAVFKSPDGQVMHAKPKVDRVTFYVMDEVPEYGALSPGAPSIGRVAPCRWIFASPIAMSFIQGPSQRAAAFVGRTCPESPESARRSLLT